MYSESDTFVSLCLKTSVTLVLAETLFTTYMLALLCRTGSACNLFLMFSWLKSAYLDHGHSLVNLTIFRLCWFYNKSSKTWSSHWSLSPWHTISLHSVCARRCTRNFMSARFACTTNAICKYVGTFIKSPFKSRIHYLAVQLNLHLTTCSIFNFLMLTL